jgi:hypothetical protein
MGFRERRRGLTIVSMNSFAAFALVGSALIGCARNHGDDDQVTAESALDSASSVQAEGDLMAVNIEGANMLALTSDEIAQRIAANIGLRWPSSCRTIEQTGNAITVTYNDCTGPRGLLHVSGTLVLTVQVKTDGSIQVHGASGNLTVNDFHLVMNVDALYSTNGTTHSLDVTTSGESVGPRGAELDHVGDYTVTWDSATLCRSLDGSWATEATLADGTTGSRSTVVDVTRCVGSCPTGTIVRTFRTGVTLTITFDGSSTATWETSNGRSGTKLLPCGA